MGISAASSQSPFVSTGTPTSASAPASTDDRASKDQAASPVPVDGFVGPNVPKLDTLPTPTPLPSTPIETLYTDPFHQDLMGNRLAELIGTATKTLDGAFYEIADPRMLTAFCAAAQRGVAVRLVTDDNYFRTDETQTLLDRRVLDLGKVNDWLTSARRLKTDDPSSSTNAQKLLDGFADVQKALDDAALPSTRNIDLAPAKAFVQSIANGDGVNAAIARKGLLDVSSQVSSNLSEYRVRMLFRPSYDQLSAAGVQLRNDDSDKLSHDKYLVVDGKTSWVGSYNIQGLTSDSGGTLGAPSTADNAVILPSTTLAKVFESDFKQMFVDGKFHNDKTPVAEKEVDVNGVGVTPFVGPTGTGLANMTADLGTLLTQMRAANAAGTPMSPKPKIRMAIFSTSYNGTEALVDMLKLLKKEGADVAITADSMGATRVGSGTKNLADAGIPLTVTTSDMMLHHKFLSIDAGPMQLVWTGSTNFTHPAFFENDETGLRLSSADEVKAYEAIYDSLKAHKKTAKKSFGGEVEIPAGRPDPLTFDPNSIQTLDDARRYAQSLED